MAAFKVFPQGQSKFEIPLLAKKNVLLGDVFSSQDNNPAAPMSAGLFRLNNGDPVTYAYRFDEMKIILRGEFHISDTTGQEIVARPGDILYIPNGSTLTFTTPDTGLAYYVGQRKEGKV
ncbi:ethanolamine utilization protein EutQ [Penicillium malachiteum]|nr:ethanolamine utilization protein EutQ [Penicillium malachiteum]